MSNPKLTLIFEGLLSENGKVRLHDLINALRSFSAATRRFDKEMSASGTETFYYRIVDLKYSSPMTLVTEVCPRKASQPMNIGAIPRAITFWQDIKEGRLHQPIDLPQLEDIQRLADDVQKGMSKMRISFKNDKFEITPEFKAKVELILATKESFPGSVRGVMEYLNIHGSQKVFRVYSDVEPRVINCHFPEDLKEKAKEAIDRHVEVRGMLFYKSIAKFPDQIEAKEIEIFPDESELPNILDLKGIAPDLAEGLSSEEFTRKIRNAVQN